MSRFAAGFAGRVILGLSLIAPFTGVPAVAQPDDRKGGRGATRPAPTVREAPALRQMPATRQSQPVQAPRRAVPERALTGAQPSEDSAQRRLQVLQQQRQSGRLNRAEQRELRELRRTSRAQQNQQTAKPDIQQSIAPHAQQNADRLKELQQQRRLNRAERRELRELQRVEGQRQRQERQARQQQATRSDAQRLQRLQQQRHEGRLSREERRELRQLRRAERKEFGNAGGPRRGAWHTAMQSRFASKFHDRREGREARRAARLAANAAWGLGLPAHHVPWYGPVYWPYAYQDIFYYPFWPSAFEPGYWAFVYDDFFDGMFFPDGAPTVDYAYIGPYAPPTAGTTGAAPRRGTPGRSAERALPDACAEQAKIITARPFEQIEQAVRIDGRQKDLLAELRRVSADVAERFKEACPENLPMTPPGRLQAMVMRLQTTLDAVKAARPALETLYESLNDEQRSRFNEIGPAIGQRRVERQQRAEAGCGGEMAGLSSVPLEQIEEVVQPTDAQLEALDQLDEALMKAVAILSQACPTTVEQTPAGRLDAMEKRLEAMIAAATAVRPALDDFYAVLSDEQKAKFNRMGRNSARASR